jgi:hypothetical protein
MTAEKFEKRQKALRNLIDAVAIHADSLEKKATHFNESFKQARLTYVGQLRDDIRTVRSIRFDGETKLKERLYDLGLEESVDLLHAVEDHIRELRNRAYPTSF